MLRLIRARRRLTPEDYAVSALWGAFDCARAGMTCIADTSFEGWTSARAAREAGLRARIYLEVFGLDDAKLPQVMERLEDRLAGLREECSSVMEPGISPHAPYTVSWRLYRELARFGKREGYRLATHVAESEAEVELLKEGTGPIALAHKAAKLWTGVRWQPPGVSPVAHLASAGALSPDMLAVHAIQVDDADIQVLAETGTPVAHCPRSNILLQCGKAPVARMREAGVLVALGTDSLASNDSLDMFAEMRAAMQLSREPDSDGRMTKPLTAGEVLRMATIDSAKALGLQTKIGTLEAGKAADIIAVRLPDAVHARVSSSTDDSRDLEARVVSADAMDVDMTMVGGEMIFDLRSGLAHKPPDLPGHFAVVRMKLGL
jgi:5-methylthioadenosine/S-adenosylhomocysteine deaminase